LHRTKKMTVVTTGLALLMAAGVSSAMAANNGNDNHKVTVCHATGSAKNPYVRIHVSKNAAENAGHYGHEGDEIYEDDVANTHPCPTTPPPDGGDDHDVTICHPLGDGKFERIHVSENDEKVVEHAGHDDHIIQDDDDFWQCPGTHDDGDDDDNGDGDGGTSQNCSASSTSSTEQHGLVNANVDANNAASNVLCQSQILSNLNASVLGFSSPFGTEALAAGPGGLLSGLTADVNVLAKVLVLF